MNAYIRATGSFLPPDTLSNDELAKTVDTSDEWIMSHTGIRNRRIADPHTAASDLGHKAASAAIESAGIDPGEIDLVIAATATPDYPGFPSTACIIQNSLGLRSAGAFDIAAACTGFVYGLETARAYIKAGLAGTILLVGTEIMSRTLNWKDRNTCVLFGDGAGAVIVSRHSGSERGLFDSILRSDGSGDRALLRPAGGTRNPFIPGVTGEEELFIKMDGRRVYTFAVQAICDVVTELCTRNRLQADDITWIVPHQANIRIIEAASRRLGIPQEKFFMNIEEYANTSAASIPIALDEMNGSGRLHAGDLVLTVGFGGGLTWGGNLMRW